MLYPQQLHRGRLIRRYKRFLADIELADGRVVTAHCPNPGSMLGVCRPGADVLLRLSADSRRKLPFTWTFVFVDGAPVNVDTQIPNPVVAEAVAAGKIPELSGYRSVRREVTFLDSRFDLCLAGEPDDIDTGSCLVEVKSTTLAEEGVAMFPDAPTERGRKHLNTLIEARRRGIRAVQFYCISRGDVRLFRPADHIDARYGDTLRRAVAAGVETMAWDVRIDIAECAYAVELCRPVPIDLNLSGLSGRES